MREHLDADFAHGAEFTAVAKHALESNIFVLEGCSITKTGDFELTVSSGDVAVNGTETAVSEQTVNMSPEDTFVRRYDLLTVDTAGTVNVTEGTEASMAPPIPEDEVLIGIVKVDEDAQGVASEDIIDTRIVFAINHNLLSEIGPNDHIDDITDIPNRDHNDLNNIGENDHIDNLDQIPNRDHNDLNQIGENDHIDNLSQIPTREYGDLQSREHANEDHSIDFLGLKYFQYEHDTVASNTERFTGGSPSTEEFDWVELEKIDVTNKYLGMMRLGVSFRLVIVDGTSTVYVRLKVDGNVVESWSTSSDTYVERTVDIDYSDFNPTVILEGKVDSDGGTCQVDYWGVWFDDLSDDDRYILT